MTSAMQPRPRPSSDKELGFTRRKAVRWFSPPTLARAATKVVLSAAFGIPAMFQLLAVGSLVIYFAVAFSSRAGRAALTPSFRSRISADR